ncbi:hypothetical protein [Kineothrix sp. MB12-C1]|uniref:hypothetical protein n=1 Tax=Kineothrix sp. MB12-C1 TaxID=3070215 RepID=UPI0027D3042F|nr:hypothetical protein [Kineothrix sp. MB12-C1]WMC92242.1 hypothetical protein RBB56_15520 [Kineothrix sp. MB12-C1]
MKHSKWIAIIFTIFNLILVIICGVVWFRTDRISPEFKFRLSELVYEEDTTEYELLEGITAIDNRDGDITDRIVIEKVIKSEKENSVVVFYAVSDAAGNVVKTSRIFPAVFVNEEKEEQILSELNDAETEAAPEIETENMDEIPVEENEDIEDQQEDEVEQEEDILEEQDSDAETEVTNQGDSVSQSVENENAEQTRIGAAPVITLKASEVTTKQGIPPAWVDVIGSLTDDIDDYETLFSNLNVSKYDINTVGDYKVSLTVMDSNKNTSKPVTLTVHVK